MTRLSTCLALLLLVPSVAAAQKVKEPAPPPSSISVQIAGLNCSTPAGTGIFKVNSWTWGASNTGTVLGGTSSAGRPALQDLAVDKAFDGCSPALLELVTTGSILKRVTLVQTAADGTRSTTVDLDAVLVSSWTLGSNTAEPIPTETLSFNFRKICVTDGATGANSCYDVTSTTP